MTKATPIESNKIPTSVSESQKALEQGQFLNVEDRINDFKDAMKELADKDVDRMDFADATRAAAEKQGGDAGKKEILLAALPNQSLENPSTSAESAVEAAAKKYFGSDPSKEENDGAGFLIAGVVVVIAALIGFSLME